jgi:hypothetical protein
MSNRYISKPEIIEAIQYDGTNADKLKKLDTDRQAILIDGKGLYLKHFDEFDFLICEEGIGKEDWLVRYEDGETLELFTDDEFKECFLKMSEKHMDHATGWLSDFIKQREIDIDETVSTYLTSKIKQLEDNNLGIVVMIDADSIPEGIDPLDYCESFKNIADHDLPQGVKRLNLNNNKDIAYYKQQLNNIGGRWAEPNSTFEDNVQKLKEQREVNKRIQNYFDNSKTVHERLDEKIKQYSEFKFSKFLQSLKQLIKEVEDDTSK